MPFKVLTSEIVEKRLHEEPVDITCDMVRDFMKLHVIDSKSSAAQETQINGKENDNRKKRIYIRTREEVFSQYEEWYDSKEYAAQLASKYCKAKDSLYMPDINAIYEYIEHKKALPSNSRTEIIFLLIKDAIHEEMPEQIVFPIPKVNALIWKRNLSNEITQAAILKLKEIIMAKCTNGEERILNALQEELNFSEFCMSDGVLTFIAENSQIEIVFVGNYIGVRQKKKASISV